MLRNTNKLRAVFAVGIASAALVGSGVASAATVVQQPGAGTPVLASHPTTVAQVIDPNKVFGANDEWPTSRCEDLANLINMENAAATQAANNGNATAAANYTDDQAADQETLDNNCGVMD